MNAERLLNALIEGGPRFVIVGGVAMNLHGSAQNTNDLDIVYARDVENIRRLVNCLTSFAPRLRTVAGSVRFRFDVRTIENGLNFVLETSGGNLDLIGEIPGLGDYDAVLASASEVKLGNRRVRVLSLAGLIRAKRAAGRPKDIAALPELEALEEIERETERPILALDKRKRPKA